MKSVSENKLVRTYSGLDGSNLTTKPFTFCIFAQNICGLEASAILSSPL